MNLAVVNDSGVRVDVTNARRLAAFFLEKAARLAGHGWHEVSLVIRDDSGMETVNRAFLNHDGPTDVISFAYDALPGEAAAAASGEIMVNAAMALRLGRRFGGPGRELALYIAHGCDHLAGADDHTPAMRRRMRSRDLRWVRQAKAAGLLESLFSPDRA